MPKILGFIMYERAKSRLLQYIGDAIGLIPADSGDDQVQEKREALLKALKIGSAVCRPTEFWADRDKRRRRLADSGVLHDLERTVVSE